MATQDLIVVHLEANKDTVFQEWGDEKFRFDKRVASVFDDMITRSVPYYTDVQKLVVKIVESYTQAGDTVVDLGCSTGNTLIAIATSSAKPLRLIGIDTSPDMLSLATLKSQTLGLDVEYVLSDIFDYPLFAPRVVIINYTLQFLPLASRTILLRNIYEALPHGGVLIVSEKMVSGDETLNEIMIKIYHEYKIEQGYSNLEIIKKKEALDDVLIPQSMEQNIAMLKTAGFGNVEILFKWDNFATMVATNP